MSLTTHPRHRNNRLTIFTTKVLRRNDEGIGEKTQPAQLGIRCRGDGADSVPSMVRGLLSDEHGTPRCLEQNVFGAELAEL